MRAAAALALSGRYALPGRQAAAGLRAWARAAGVHVEIEDAGSDPAATARRYVRLADRTDLLFGPYGSGPTRAVAEALADGPAVIWNHGGAAIEPTGARVVSVLGPAERYWAGLAEVLRALECPLRQVAILSGRTGFGRATAGGAIAALRRVGHEPLLVEDLEAERADASAAKVLSAGARAVVAGGRIEEEAALGRALFDADVAVGLVLCGTEMACEMFGEAVEGWFGPAQWWPGGPPPPIALPPGADYPAAQALATGLIAQRAVSLAGSLEPDALWASALKLRTRTFLGPFAVDRQGRQVAHAPLIVRWVRVDGQLRREVAWRP